MLNYQMALKSFENILVRGPNWVGDAVMFIPALRALGRACPEARISLLVKPWVGDLFLKEPAIDEIIEYPAEASTLIGKYRLARGLRKRGFDLAVLFQNAFDAALIAFLAGIPRRVGYARDARSWLLTDPIPYRGQDREHHHIDYYLMMLRSFGLDIPEGKFWEPWLALDLEERLAARKRLEGLRRPLLGLNPGAAFGSSKRWPPAGFAEVAAGFNARTGGSVAVFGGPGERGMAGEIEEAAIEAGLPSSVLLNLAGRTSLRELCALLSECDLLLTNDSGPMHVGYAVKTPLAAVFGSTSPELTGPPGAGSRVLKKGLKCSPCFKRTCPEEKTGSTGLACMEGVGPEEVLETLAGLLPEKKAVFFDRDGTLCRDAHFLKRWEDFELLDGIRELERLREAGYLLVGVSNQSGIGRGYVEEGFVKEVNSYFMEKHGFAGFLYCPHKPGENCFCRKPLPGMLAEARSRLKIDLRSSFMVGDKELDIKTGLAAGCTTVQVLTGPEGPSERADYRSRGLGECVDWILAQTAGRPEPAVEIETERTGETG